jgi:D-3-phosphoglycerate dehydrogenase
MRIRFDCPLDFLEQSEFDEILSNNDLVVDKENPEIVIVNPGTDKFLNEQAFFQYKSLRVVATPSTGVNHIDVDYLKSRDVNVFCLLDDRAALDNIHASAEFTWLHLMNLSRKFTLSLDRVDEWRNVDNEKILRSNELHSKKIGIVGLGRIGKKIANYANAFGMSILYYDPYVAQCQAPDYAKKIEYLSDLCICDAISINCYLTKETNRLITWGSIDNIKSGTILVNTSRGEVVDEAYICHLIENKSIKYAADVLCNEQNIESLRISKLLKLSKQRNDVIISPHVAGATYESQKKALEAVIKISMNSF